VSGTFPAYREDRSALSWPLLACGLFGPLAVVAACVILGLVVNPQWFIGLVFLLLSAPAQIYVGLLYRNWPTGIRLDETSISIGAVRSGRAAGRTPTVTHQSWGLFTCPRSAVRSARVVTDPAEVRRLRKAPLYYTLTNRWGSKRDMTYCNLGVLTSPFMRAALVIDVDPGAVTAPRARAARMFSNGKDGRMSRLIPPALSPTWIVPTRHPEDLSAALAALAPSD
jgi:hypothetical protein